MKVKVTNKHIKDGCQLSWASCPVALALREVTGAKSVAVSGTLIQVNTKKYDPPKKVKTFIRRFDTGENVSPFSFEIDL